MERQVWVGRNKISKEEFSEVSGNRHIYCKPKGGFWTSSFREDLLCDWFRVVFPNSFMRFGGFVYFLEVDSGANVFHIDSVEDLEWLGYKYGKIYCHENFCVEYLDFVELSRDFDGVHLTRKGWRDAERLRRDSYMEVKGSFDFYLSGWSCECTVWFDWCFSDFSLVGKVGNIALL